jgi:hypothetical protein
MGMVRTRNGWGAERVVGATPSSLPAANSLKVHLVACRFGSSPAPSPPDVFEPPRMGGGEGPEGVGKGGYLLGGGGG